MITVYVQSTCHRRRFWTSVLPSAPLLRFLAPLKLRPYGAIQMCILLLLFTTSLPAGVPRIAITLSLCLSVCLCIHVYMPVHMSVRWHVSKITRTNIAKFRVHVIYGRGSDHTTARYVLPVLWMTSRSHITTGQNQQTMLFGWVHQLAAPVTDAPRAWGGAKSATFDCLVYWFLIRNFQQEALLPQRDRATCYVSQFVLFSRGMEVTKVPNSKSDLQLQGHSRALAMVPFDRPHTIFC